MESQNKAEILLQNLYCSLTELFKAKDNDELSQHEITQFFDMIWAANTVRIIELERKVKE